MGSHKSTRTRFPLMHTCYRCVWRPPPRKGRYSLCTRSRIESGVGSLTSQSHTHSHRPPACHAVRYCETQIAPLPQPHSCAQPHSQESDPHTHTTLTPHSALAHPTPQPTLCALRELYPGDRTTRSERASPQRTVICPASACQASNLCVHLHTCTTAT